MGIPPSCSGAAMIRIRRVRSGLPLVRMYELEFDGAATDAPVKRENLRRGIAVRRLERELGTGDAWSFVQAADEAWDAGETAWAVAYQSPRGAAVDAGHKRGTARRRRFHSTTEAYSRP